MLTPYFLTEAENADTLRKRRADDASVVNSFKAALAPDRTLVVGSSDGGPFGDVVPFKKREQSPPRQQPRPPAQQPMRQPYRPAATADLAKLVAKSREPGVRLNKAELHILATQTSEFGKYLNAKLIERCPDTISAIQKRAGRR